MNSSATSNVRPGIRPVAALRFIVLRLALLAAVLSISPAVRAVTLPFYDGFAYTDNTPLGAVGSGGETVWTIGNSVSGTTPLTTSAATLTYTGLPVAMGFGVQLDNPGASSKERGVDTVSYSMTGAGETLYASFLLNVQSYPASNCPVAYYDDNAGASGSFQGIGMLPDGRLTLHRNAAVTAPGGTNASALSLNTTYLIVFRYKSVSLAGNDELKLWINPTLGQPSETAADLTMAVGGTDRTALRGFFWKQDTAFSGIMYVDELRLGTNWTEVTPGAATCDTASISSGPTNTTVEAGNAAVFSVASAGTSRAHQWQESTDSGSSWNNTSTGTGSTTAAYNTGATTSGQNSYQYRCIVSVACNSSSVTSSVATLTVNCNTAGISSHPSNIAVSAGQTANFSVTATGSSPTYQWEYSSDNGANWSAVSAGTGATTSSYTTAATTTGENGYQYRCVVSVACDASSLASSPATLTVNCDTASITSNPSSGAVPEGLPANFSVTATGSSPAYQWQVSIDSGANWADVSTGTGGTTANHATAATALGENGYQYRCIVTTPCDSQSVTSTVATLTVVNGSGASFRSAASGRWQDASTWELSGDDGASWFPAGIAPTSVNSTNILVAAGTTVSNLSARMVDQVVVATGGTLVVSNTLTVAAGSAVDLDVYGTVIGIGGSSALTIQSGVAMVVESGGIFAHDGTSGAGVNNSGTITVASGGKFQLRRAGGTIPILTWDVGSTCEVAYSTASTSRPAAQGQTFDKFLWNNPLQSGEVSLAGELNNINGDFLLADAAGQRVKWTGDANFGGNLTISNGILNVSSDGVARTWTLKGNLTIAASGSLDVSATASATNKIIINGSGTQNYTCDGSNIATKLFWTVEAGSTLNLNNDLPLTASGRTMTANGTVNLNGNALLADVVTGTGTIRNQGGGSGFLVVGVNNNVTNTLDGTLALLNGVSGSLGLAKGAGSGLLTITAPHTFGGGLVVSNGTVLVNNLSGSGTGSGAVTVVDGTFGGTGTIAGSVTVESAGNLAPGASIDDLTISGALTLGGTFTAEVNTGVAPNTDQVLGTSAVNYGGTLQVQNQGGALTASDTFQIFPSGTRTGTFTLNPATPDNNAGLAWNTSTLTTDGTLRISTVAVGPDTTPTNLVSSVSGGNLTLTWPSSHVGWELQAQTNSRSVGLSNNWSAYGYGYADTNEAVIAIDKITPTVFFRLFYQIP
jgi:autotransporter-associated beta strand protein